MKEGINENIPGPRDRHIEDFLAYTPPLFARDKVGVLGTMETLLMEEPYLSFYVSESGDPQIEEMKLRWRRHDASNTDILELAEAFADWQMIHKGKIVEGRFENFRDAEKAETEERQKAA
ncbi:MAG: hypothetical protein COV07_02435 [Candidatus Vogelbacteria bacterium CG10_big_fil_rev_8_21_14_0_10_45_14]|uniref:Uncharacterized protein n=1 Tax=Candidatus Vogelbacteria bacterium CG10_big_fil_rev_8_21_14_0_10_45_14 TaxID=1975042 RepID=A0A2H0RK61_9BACT|nr:MAG: hypothetical protein COV07_02435 [Candidatus Vogelbacteria bacterium CG10_big_fil_rev_8_21_14_0_10_45_14]